MKEGARRWAPSRLLIGLVGLTIVFLAGCDNGSTIGASKLSQLVLTESDMQGFASFSNGPQVRLDNQGTTRADANRYGREGGWLTRFHPASSTTVKGPLLIESRADLFKSADGAKSDFALYHSALLTNNGGSQKEIVVAGLPQDSIGVTFTQPGGRTLRFYRIAWRDRNATASITVEGFDGDITQEQAIAIAKKQEARMKGA